MYYVLEPGDKAFIIVNGEVREVIHRGCSAKGLPFWEAVDGGPGGYGQQGYLTREEAEKEKEGSYERQI
jgi:hypothetical protein